MSTLNLRPLGNHVWLEPLTPPTETESGIILPPNAQEKPQQGTVLGVGAGLRLETGERRPPEVQPGDRVLYPRFGGTEIKHDGTTYLLIRESDLLAIVLEG